MLPGLPKRGSRKWREYAGRRLPIDDLIGLRVGCIENARSLIIEAQLLLENEHPERAYYLACIAMEELGKGLFLGGMQVLIATDEPLEDDPWVFLWSSWTDHPSKLRPTSGFSQAIPAVDRWLESKREEVEAALAHGGVAGALKLLGGGTMPFAIEALAKSEESATTLDQRKFAALYVDWSSRAGLRIPSVAREQAERAIALVEIERQSAEAFIQLVMDDPQMLRWFVNEFRGEIARAFSQ